MGNNIKRCWLKNNLSQLPLAERVDISTNFLSDIERSKAWVSPNILVKLASVLKIEPYELFKADALLTDTEKGLLQHYVDENLKAVLSVLNQLREN